MLYTFINKYGEPAAVEAEDIESALVALEYCEEDFDIGDCTNIEWKVV